MGDRKVIGTVLVGMTLSTAAVVGLFWWFNEYQNRSRRKSRDQISAADDKSVDSPSGSQLTKSKKRSVDEDVNVKVNGTVGGGVPIDTKAGGDVPDGNVDNKRVGNSDKVKEEESREGESDRQQQLALEVEIAKENVPALIGKAGVTIRRIQRESNTKVDFKSTETGDRVCVIRGRPDDVALAEDLIKKHLAAQPTVIQHQLGVPQVYIGRIIGRSGETIRTIQDFSRARVNVDSNKESDSDDNRIVTIKGTQEQVDVALKMIHDKIQEEKNFREKIKAVAANRTQRRVITPTGSTSVHGSPVSSVAEKPVETASSMLSTSKGVFDVYISCVYHPNMFWIQQVGPESIELDKLGEAITVYYMNENPRIGANQPEREFEVGDIVAAPFHVDNRMYRAKIVQLLDNRKAEVEYVDYGDRGCLDINELRVMMPQFLSLKFQAIEATLNLETSDSKWSDDAITTFCDLSYCAQWKPISAKVRSSFNSPDGSGLRWWVDLMNGNTNIREELIRNGFGKSGEDSSNKKGGGASD